MITQRDTREAGQEPEGTRGGAQTPRRHELDWIRSLVVLGLIPVHTAVIFSPTADTYLKNAQTTPLMALLGAFASTWGMPLLFLVAGASAWFALGVRRPRRYVGERLTRLGVPFVFATLTIIPLQVYFVLRSNPGLLHAFQLPISATDLLASYPGFYVYYLIGYGYFLTHFSPALVPIFWGHLWFIPRLLVFALLTLPLCLYLRAGAGRRLVDWLAAAAERPGVILLWGLPLSLSDAALQSGWLNRVTAGWWLYDDWPQFFFFLLCFLYGYVLFADARFTQAIRRHGVVALVLGAVAWTVAELVLVHDTVTPLSTWLGAIGLLPLHGIIAWLWMVALLSFAMRYLSCDSAALRYLNEATYPIYVLHMPILTAIGLTVLGWSAGIGVKYLVIITVTAVATLGIYDLVIKRVGILRFLFGMKPRQAHGSSPAARPPTGPGRSATAAPASPESVQSAAGEPVETVDCAALAWPASPLLALETSPAHASVGPHSAPTLRTTERSSRMSAISYGREIPGATPSSSLASEEPSERNLALLFRKRSATYAGWTRWNQQRGGVWISATWRENQAIVNSLLAGLAALGAQPGDHIGILSHTRWEWTAADWAVLGLGAVTVTLYPSNTPATLAYMLNDAQVRFLFAEDRTQYQKLASIREALPALQKLILFQDAELAGDDPWVLSFDTLQGLSGYTPAQADALAADRAEAIAPDAPATIVYTSGTTGEPKGVVHTHRTLLAQVHGVRAMLPELHAGMVHLMFLPLAHVLGREEHLMTVDFAGETYIPESMDHVATALPEVRPQLLLGVPRVFEKAHAAILADVATRSAMQQRIFAWAMRVGQAVVPLAQAHRPLPLALRLQRVLADWLVFRQVRAALGGRLELAITGAAPMDLNVLTFFHAAGVRLLEGWGLTETGGAITVNRARDYRLGTVGQLFPGHELRIADDGEILLRGPCVATGYYQKPEATSEAFDAEGWFHTGDIGTLDAGGFLRISDRKKDLIATAAGKKVAPQYLENLLRRIPGVAQAAVFGDRMPYLVALLTLDAQQVRAWAAGAGADPDTRTIGEIGASPAFRSYLDAQIAQLNAQLASYETIKRYHVLVDQEFSTANDLLTPTEKIRRRQIAARYREEIAQLYAPTGHAARGA